ncbi:MAG TPA: hypothetical protein VFW21_08495 [Mycobacterium sp.]|nr:hypothetical protein [Mycobacterium sp.]
MSSDITDITAAVSAEPTWGSPAGQPQWSKGKIAAAVGIAIVLGGAGAAAIYAAEGGGSSGHGPGGGPGWGPPSGPGGAGPMGGGPVLAGMDNALHGQFVVPDDHGGYRTQSTQTGTVTDISDTAVTARSADGYTQTYVVTTETRKGRDAVHTGDTATIRAVEQNGISTATVIAPSR